MVKTVKVMMNKGIASLILRYSLANRGGSHAKPQDLIFWCIPWSLLTFYNYPFVVKSEVSANANPDLQIQYSIQ